MEKNCPQCGVRFDVASNSQKYCSGNCCRNAFRDRHREQFRAERRVYEKEKRKRDKLNAKTRTISPRALQKVDAQIYKDLHDRGILD